MKNERLVKLSSSEMLRMRVCLAVRKDELEGLRKEENSEHSFINDMIKDANNDIDRELEEIDSIYDKLGAIAPNMFGDEDLDKMSKIDLIAKIKQLEDKIYELKEENEDLKYDLEEIKKSDSMTTMQVASFFTSYENIQRRYDANNVDYQMKGSEDLTKVFGLRFESIEGFNNLSEEDKEIFRSGIVKFLNGHGLGNRVPYLPVKVWKENGEFRFLTLEGGARQQFMNFKGEVY